MFKKYLQVWKLILNINFIVKFLQKNSVKYFLVQENIFLKNSETKNPEKNKNKQILKNHFGLKNV